MAKIIVYTDGACEGNPGPGGWGWYAPEIDARGSGGDSATTNNRMELAAVLAAMNELEGELEIYSDSKYIVDCFQKEWWKKWVSKGWLNAKKEPVKNQDLWEPILQQAIEREVKFVWVKGHSGDLGNEEADRLAVEAVALYR